MALECTDYSVQYAVYQFRRVRLYHCLWTIFQYILYGIEGDSVNRFPNLSGTAEGTPELGAATGTAAVLVAVLGVIVHSHHYCHHKPRQGQHLQHTISQECNKSWLGLTFIAMPIIYVLLMEV